MIINYKCTCYTLRRKEALSKNVTDERDSSLFYE